MLDTSTPQNDRILISSNLLNMEILMIASFCGLPRAQEEEKKTPSFFRLLLVLFSLMGLKNVNYLRQLLRDKFFIYNSVPVVIYTLMVRC